MALARALAVEPEVLLLDEPFGALDAQVRKELRTWLRRLHDEVHVTTVFVTHDQEEAMDVADRIVVLAGGRVEQIGSPHEIYDNPANAFVMGFLGAVTTLDGRLVRPHDIEISTAPAAGVGGRDVNRIVRLGFEERIEMSGPDGEIMAQVLRGGAEQMRVTGGDTVWIRPRDDARTLEPARVIAIGGGIGQSAPVHRRLRKTPGELLAAAAIVAVLGVSGCTGGSAANSPAAGHRRSAGRLLGRTARRRSGWQADADHPRRRRRAAAPGGLGAGPQGRGRGRQVGL